MVFDKQKVDVFDEALNVVLCCSLHVAM